jgi:hypothetical protein
MRLVLFSAVATILAHGTKRIALTVPLLCLVAQRLSSSLCRTQDVVVLEKGYAKADSRSAPITKLEIRIREGRNRQIRRMCEAVQCPVLTLKRVAFGPVRLDSRLRRGQSRPLTPNEIKALNRGVGASAEGLRGFGR